MLFLSSHFSIHQMYHGWDFHSSFPYLKSRERVCIFLSIVEHQFTDFKYPTLFKELAAVPGGPLKVCGVDERRGLSMCKGRGTFLR